MQWDLIRLRKEAGLTQENLAKMIGANVTTYMNKETGKTQFKANEMFIISDFFKKPIEDIFLSDDSILNGINKRKSI